MWKPSRLSHNESYNDINGLTNLLIFLCYFAKNVIHINKYNPRVCVRTHALVWTFSIIHEVISETVTRKSMCLTSLWLTHTNTFRHLSMLNCCCDRTAGSLETTEPLQRFAVWCAFHQPPGNRIKVCHLNPAIIHDPGPDLDLCRNILLNSSTRRQQQPNIEICARQTLCTHTPISFPTEFDTESISFTSPARGFKMLHMLLVNYLLTSTLSQFYNFLACRF